MDIFIIIDIFIYTSPYTYPPPLMIAIHGSTHDLHMPPQSHSSPLWSPSLAIISHTILKIINPFTAQPCHMLLVHDAPPPPTLNIHGRLQWRWVSFFFDLHTSNLWDLDLFGFVPLGLWYSFWHCVLNIWFTWDFNIRRWSLACYNFGFSLFNLDLLRYLDWIFGS